MKFSSAPSPFSPEFLAAARSVVRTRQLVRVCPRCWQSDSSQMSLCHRSGHVWPVSETVQSTELLSELPSKMVVVPMAALCVLKHVHFFFAHRSELCENLSNVKERVFFYLKILVIICFRIKIQKRVFLHIY